MTEGRKLGVFSLDGRKTSICEWCYCVILTERFEQHVSVCHPETKYASVVNIQPEIAKKIMGDK